MLCFAFGLSQLLALAFLSNGLLHSDDFSVEPFFELVEKVLHLQPGKRQVEKGIDVVHGKISISVKLRLLFLVEDAGEKPLLIT